MDSNGLMRNGLQAGKRIQKKIKLNANSAGLVSREFTDDCFIERIKLVDLDYAEGVA